MGIIYEANERIYVSDKKIRGLRAKCYFYDDFITDSVTSNEELEKIIDVLNQVPEEYLVSIKEINSVLKKNNRIEEFGNG